MSAFSVRDRGYQAGLILLIVSTVLFIIGLVSPAWLVYEREIINIQEEKLYAGVFIGCKYKLRLVGASSFDFTRCSFGFAHAFAGMKDMGEWVHAVEAFEIMSAIALIFACIYGVTVNCFTIYPGPRSRLLEIVAFVAACVAFIFCMIFVAELRTTVEGNVFYSFEWAFYLSVITSIAAAVAAFLIALFNEYIPPPSDFRFSTHSLANSSNPILGSTSGFSAAPTTVVYNPHRKSGYNNGGGGGSVYGGGGSVYGGGGSVVVDEDDLYDPRVAKVIGNSYDDDDDHDDGEEEEVASQMSGRGRRGGGGRGGGRGSSRGGGGGGGVAGKYESDL